MKAVESRRIVPVSTITLVCIVLLALLQVFMLSGFYEIKSSTVKKVAPWFYDSFLKLVGEHPSASRAVSKKPLPEEKDAPSSGMATVAGFKPEDLSVTIKDAEPVVLEPVLLEEDAPTPIIPVSQPEQADEPVDEDIPVG